MRRRLAAILCLLSLFAVQSAVAAAQSQPVAVCRSDDGRTLTARFDIAGRSARVTLPDGETLTLPLALSASGARYSNGASTYWEHHGSARFERGEVLVFEGKCLDD